MRGIPVLQKYRYIINLKRYNIIILLNSVFDELLFRSSPLGGSALPKLTQVTRNWQTKEHGGNKVHSGFYTPEIIK